MTPSQKKTALLLERLAQEAHGNDQVSVHTTEPNSQGDVRATFSIRKPGMAQVHITPTGRPYFKDDEKTPPPAINYEELTDALGRGLAEMRKLYGDSIADSMAESLSQKLKESYPDLPWSGY